MTTRIQETEYKLPLSVKVTGSISTLSIFVGSVALGIIHTFALGAIAVPITITAIVLIAAGLSLAVIAGRLFYKSLYTENKATFIPPNPPTRNTKQPKNIEVKNCRPSTNTAIRPQQPQKVKDTPPLFNQFLENYIPPIIRIDNSLDKCEVLFPSSYLDQVEPLRAELLEIIAKLNGNEAEATKTSIIEKYLVSKNSSPEEINFLKNCSPSQISSLANRWLEITKKETLLAIYAEIEAIIGLTSIHGNKRTSDPLVKRLCTQMIETKKDVQKSSKSILYERRDHLGNDQIKQRTKLSKFLSRVKSKENLEATDITKFLSLFQPSTLLIGNSLSAFINLVKKIKEGQLLKHYYAAIDYQNKLEALSNQLNDPLKKAAAAAKIEELRSEIMNNHLDFTDNNEEKSFVSRINLKEFIALIPKMSPNSTNTVGAILYKVLYWQLNLEPNANFYTTLEQELMDKFDNC